MLQFRFLMLSSLHPVSLKPKSKSQNLKQPGSIFYKSRTRYSLSCSPSDLEYPLGWILITYLVFMLFFCLDHPEVLPGLVPATVSKLDPKATQPPSDRGFLRSRDLLLQNRAHCQPWAAAGCLESKASPCTPWLQSPLVSLGVKLIGIFWHIDFPYKNIDSLK